MDRNWIEVLENTTILHRNATVYPLRVYTLKDTEALPHTVTMQVKATAGLGKTRAAIEAIAANPFWSQNEVHYYAPDHEQAAEVLRIASLYGLRAILISGRTKDDESNGYCARFNMADKVAKAGLIVYRSCCHSVVEGKELRCPYFDQCPYLNQWTDQKPAFRIFVHQYIFLPKPSKDGISLPEPKLAVVDESIVFKSVNPFEFSVDRLQGEYAQAVQDALVYDSDLRSILLALGVTAEDADKLASETDPSGIREISPALSDRQALDILKDLDQMELLGKAAFYRAIAREIDLGRPIYGIEIRKDERVRVNGKWERQNRVHVFERKACRTSPGASILILDADANLKLNEKLFGRKIEPVEINAKRRAHVVQVYSSKLSNRALLGNSPKRNPKFTKTLTKVETIVKREAESAPRVLVIMPKVIETFLTNKQVARSNKIKGKPLFWQGAQIAHFGAIRGRDRWKAFDTVIVVGRNEPSARVIDELLRGLYSDEEGEIRFVGAEMLEQQVRGYRMSDEAHLGVETSVHPDPRGQRILEQIRECESVQAIDRIRLVHPEHPKHVIILSSIPLDISVDELVSLDEMAGTEGYQGSLGRLRKALDCEGVLPLGARDLARGFPELFPSKARARDALKAAKAHVLSDPVNGRFPARTDLNRTRVGAVPQQGSAGAYEPPGHPDNGIVGACPTQAGDGTGINGGTYQLEFLLSNHPHLMRAEYRRAGQRGKASHALIDIKRYPDPKAALSRLLGEKITSFKIQPTRNIDPKEK